MLKSRGILFDIENLSIDGSTFSKEDNLNKHLEVGENLFAYVKNIQPKIVDGYEVSSEAAQIWKGKRNLISSEKMDKKKTPIPLPSEASHHQIRGTVVDVESPGLGYLVIKEPEAEAINGDKVLFSRNRLFVEGQKLRFKARRTRRREKLCLTLKGYNTFMYASSQFSCTCPANTGK